MDSLYVVKFVFDKAQNSAKLLAEITTTTKVGLHKMKRRHKFVHT